jgi:hypothetical protein
MKKNIQELTEAEYLEEIRKARSNAPDVSSEEAYKQYLEVMGSRAKSEPCVKAGPSGGGRRKTAAV